MHGTGFDRGRRLIDIDLQRVQRQTGMMAPQAFKCRRKQLRCSRTEYSDPHVGDKRTIGIQECFLGIPLEGEDFPGVFTQNHSCVGELHASTDMLDQFDLQRPFQRSHLLGNGPRGVAKRRRGCGHTAEQMYRLKGLQFGGVEIHIAMLKG